MLLRCAARRPLDHERPQPLQPLGHQASASRAASTVRNAARSSGARCPRRRSGTPRRSRSAGRGRAGRRTPRGGARSSPVRRGRASRSPTCTVTSRRLTAASNRRRATGADTAARGPVGDDVEAGPAVGGRAGLGEGHRGRPAGDVVGRGWTGSRRSHSQIAVHPDQQRVPRLLPGRPAAVCVCDLDRSARR